MAANPSRRAVNFQSTNTYFATKKILNLKKYIFTKDFREIRNRVADSIWI